MTSIIIRKRKDITAQGERSHSWWWGTDWGNDARKPRSPEDAATFVLEGDLGQALPSKCPQSQLCQQLNFRLVEIKTTNSCCFKLPSLCVCYSSPEEPDIYPRGHRSPWNLLEAASNQARKEWLGLALDRAWMQRLALLLNSSVPFPGIPLHPFLVQMESIPTSKASVRIKIQNA